MNRRDYMLDKFRIHGHILTTEDMVKDPRLAAEYRRMLCELRDRGYIIVKTKLEDNLFRYELREPDTKGQLGFAL